MYLTIRTIVYISRNSGGLTNDFADEDDWIFWGPKYFTIPVYTSDISRTETKFYSTSTDEYIEPGISTLVTLIPDYEKATCYYNWYAVTEIDAEDLFQVMPSFVDFITLFPSNTYQRIIFEVNNGYIVTASGSGSNFQTRFYTQDHINIGYCNNFWASCYAPIVKLDNNDNIINFSGLRIGHFTGDMTFANAGDTRPTNFNNILLFLNGIDRTEPGPEPTSDDPYGPDSGGPGYSGTGGGPGGTGGTGATGTGGLHDDTSDVIPIPIPPTDIITSAGLITAYNPSTSQLATFANKLWNGDPTTIGDWFRLLFGGDAFNAIIGIHLLPVSPATSGSPVHIKLGNWDTEAEAPKIINQYVQHTFGTIMLPEYWGNCIDYAPYTKIQLALPYIGIVDVDTDDVLGSENTLTYNIDVYSGAICAMLRCIKGNLSSVIYQWSGSCGVEIPITGANKSAILSTVVAGSAITGAAGAIGGIVGAVAANAALAGTAASSYGTMKGKVQKQGNFSPNSGAMGIMTPYFILTRPVQSVPETWQADKGYPANISAQLGTLTGYTEVSEINLECSGTEAEKKEIIDLLKKGVLF